MLYRTAVKTYNYYWSEDKELARSLKSLLGFTPYRLSLFKMAFYHKSMHNGKSEYPNNERLEYLGDAILSTIVAEYLFKKYPYKDEGFLTKMRSKIVKRKTLNNVADKMGLDVILSEYSQGNLSKSMLGNAFEAMVGALYMELGYRHTKNYVIKNIIMKFIDIHELETHDDNYKSQLLEWGQKDNHKVSYRTLEQKKVSNRDRFKVGVFIDGKQIAIAEGFSKKAAEQHASRKALQTSIVQDVQ